LKNRNINQIKHGRLMWWAREDSNLQPDRYERSALTVELRARQAKRGVRPNTMHARARQLRPPSRRGRCAKDGGTRIPPQVVVRALKPIRYMRKSRLALPLKILILSSAHSGTVSIHCTAGLLATKGQSTTNRMRSMPISITQHNSAGLEKLPLVVM